VRARTLASRATSDSRRHGTPHRYGTSGTGGPARLYSISSVSGTNCFMMVRNTVSGALIAPDADASQMTARGRFAGNMRGRRGPCANPGFA
jgi:hypothetical protein